MRKSDAFAFLPDGNEAVKTVLNILEKFCEKSTRLLYRLVEPYKPTSGDVEKSFVGYWTN